MKDKICPNCYKRCARTESLSKGLCLAFIRFAEFAGEKPKHLRKVFTNATVIANFQKLSYFGLVEKAEQTGFWRITQKGLGFLQGEKIVKQVEVIYKRATPVAGATVTLSEVLGLGKVWNTKSDFTPATAQAELFK